MRRRHRRRSYYPRHRQRLAIHNPRLRGICWRLGDLGDETIRAAMADFDGGEGEVIGWDGSSAYG